MELKLAIYTFALFRNSYIVELLFCGAIALLALFIGVLFLRSREKLYFYYFLFLLFSFLAAGITVLAFDWQTQLIDFSSDMMRKNRELVTLLGLFAYCLFTLELLKLKEQDMRLYRWIIILAAITSLYGLIYWVFYPSIKPYEGSFFIGSRLVILPMSLLAIIGVSYRTESDFKSYFIIGSIFYLAGALIAVVREVVLGLTIPYFYQYSASVYFYFGIFLEVICFTLALNHRVFLIYQRQKRENEDLKQRAMYERDIAMVRVLGSQAQHNPHFIFNQFSAIKYLIQRRENTKAIKLLMIYSRFIRQILDVGTQQEITLKQELDILRKYLRLEAIRKGQNFLYAITVDPGVDLERTLLPPIILQPYIEPILWRDFQTDKRTVKELQVRLKDIPTGVVVGILLAEKGKEGLQDMETIRQDDSYAFNNERLRIYNRSHRNKINCYRKAYRKENDDTLSAIMIVFFIEDVKNEGI